ncbi:hypothetical protein H5410_061344 [Solanum commersonii]|uniref:Polyprotein protein n=1 Tax=Solanum commersonii TaxID=4109 RepID=A0A9J5W7R0_SOLCO|nr:hypothetical protein H5410_061344 [Solanum commersonii]
MRAKYRRISLAIPVPITKLSLASLKYLGYLRDIEVTHSFSTDIRCIEAEYTREEADRRRAALIDTSPEVDIDLLPEEASSTTPAFGPSGTAVISTSSQNVILAALTPLRGSIDDLSIRVTTCERRKGEASEVTALQAEIADLRKDDVDDEDDLEIPQATTGDVQRDESTMNESNAETDEEQIQMQEESIHRDLPNLAKISMHATTILAEVTLGTKTREQTDAPGINA